MDSGVQREIHDSCFCLALQRAARAVARRYDRAFKQIGITSGQFSIMAVVSGLKPLPLTKVARILGQDRTTLTRNIASMKRNGLIATTTGDDERVRGLSLTPRGQRLLSEALPLWRSAQRESTRLAGQTAMQEMRPYLDRLSDTSFTAG